jgi:phage major head subunit gpT-like protein
LKILRAVDAVDSPAANPDGLFQDGQEIAADADALLSYSLGLRDEAPELVELGIDPDRGAGFVKRFLNEHGLEVVSKSDEDSNKENEMAKTKTQTDLEATDPIDGEDVARDAPVQPKPTPVESTDQKVDMDKAKDLGAIAERKRQAALRELAGDDVSAELLTKTVEEGWSVEEAAPEFLKDVRSKRADPVRVGQDRGEDLNAALTNAILLAGDQAFPGIDEKAKREAEQFGGIGLQDLGRILVARSGKKVPHDADRLFESAVSTADLPNILGTAMRRGLHKAYDEYPSVYRIIAASREVKDFRTYTDIKLSEFGSMEELGDGGQFAHDTLVESTETYKAKTYGKFFALTRKTWINDDLNAFRDIPNKLGRAAARNIDELGFALLVSAAGVGPTMTEDAKALFSTTHETSNYATGAGSALADAGLVAARLLMRKIKHQGLNIEARPKFLLVPPDLEDTADRLIKSRDLLLGYRGSTDAGPTYLPPYNPHQGSLVILVKASLSSATNGTTAWYLVADPNEVPSLIYVYLRGNKNPVLERKDPADVLGIGWRVYHDAGIGVIDWRGIVRNKGA